MHTKPIIITKFDKMYKNPDDSTKYLYFFNDL